LQSRGWPWTASSASWRTSFLTWWGRGLHAGQLVKAVAQVVGGGGGKPTLAQAGGKDVSKVGEALQIVSGLVAEHLA